MIWIVIAPAESSATTLVVWLGKQQRQHAWASIRENWSPTMDDPCVLDYHIYPLGCCELCLFFPFLPSLFSRSSVDPRSARLGLPSSGMQLQKQQKSDSRLPNSSSLPQKRLYQYGSNEMPINQYFSISCRCLPTRLFVETATVNRQTSREVQYRWV